MSEFPIPEKPKSNKKKTVLIVLGVLFGLGILGNILPHSSSLDTNSTTDSQNDASSITDTPPTEDLSWIPSGYRQFSDDPSLAWRWGTSGETRCTYSDSSCWSVFVVSKDGCPSSLYGEIAILDASDVQIDYTNDTTAVVQPLQKIKLTFDTFNEDAQSARISKLNCY